MTKEDAGLTKEDAGMTVVLGGEYYSGVVPGLVPGTHWPNGSVRDRGLSIPG